MKSFSTWSCGFHTYGVWSFSYVLETDDSFFGHNAPAGAREDDSLLSNDRNARQSAPVSASLRD